MVTLYEADIAGWSERQAALLRRVAAGESPNESPDWESVIDEIETVGRSEVDAVETLLVSHFRHRLLAEAWPRSPDATRWHADARLFLRHARRKHRPSMRRKLDLSAIYGDALAGLYDDVDGVPPLPVPRECPSSLDAPLSEP